MSDLPSLDRVAVTGATGFIGRHLVRALVSEGWRPVLLTRRPKPGDQFRDVAAHVEFAYLELTDKQSIQACLEAARPSILIHMAGTRGHGATEGPAAACAAVNTRATIDLLEIAHRLEVARIVIIGSAEEYGNQAGPLHEDLPLTGTTPYGASKASATVLALAKHTIDACPVVVLRPFSVYGPGQPVSMFVSEAVSCAVSGLPFRMTEGNQRRDLIYVTDVVRALLNAATAPDIEGKAINVGSGHASRLRDVAELIWRITGTDAPLEIGARPAPEDELFDTWADVNRARELLDWEPEVGLEEGLRATIDYERQRPVGRGQ